MFEAKNEHDKPQKGSTSKHASGTTVLQINGTEPHALEMREETTQPGEQSMKPTEGFITPKEGQEKTYT